MLITLKKLLFVFTFNITLFLVLIIGIQNNSSKNKVNLLINETVNLPVGFIIGMSFISGSLTGGFLNSYYKDKKK